MKYAMDPVLVFFRVVVQTYYLGIKKYIFEYENRFSRPLIIP